jgi:hypothetical protein
MDSISKLSYRQKWDEGKFDFGIGIDGVGAIYNCTHPPKYEAAGLNVATADIDKKAR